MSKTATGLVYATLLLFHLSLAASAGAQSAKIEVVAAGKSDYVIAYAESGAEAKRITEAANLLRDIIAEASGARLPVVKETDVPPGAPAIYLGRSKAAQKAGLPVEKIAGWSYLNRTVGRDIFLVGEDSAGREELRGFSGYSGTLKAVTAFLESQAGVRFVLPGSFGIHVPKRDRFVVDGDMNVSWSPRFQFVIGRRVTPLPGREYDPYAVANNYFGRFASDTEVFFSMGGHSYPTFVPHAKYFKTNPEYFALLKGKRDHGGDRNYLCISNPEVHELLLKGMEKALDAGYQMVLLGQSDGYRECECKTCQAIHPDMGEKIWIIHRKLAEEMKKRRPGKQIVLLSYVSTTKPPMTFDSFPDNVVIMNNSYVPEYFEAWRRFNTPRIVYNPNWLGRYRRIPPRYAVDQIRLFLKNNVIGIYLCGGLDSADSAWGLNGPSYYAFGKAMENPVRNADDLEREYVDAAFGAAAGPMRGFFETMHRRFEVLALIDRRGVGVPDRRYRGHPFATLPDDHLCYFFAPEILEDMSAHLAAALDAAKNEGPKVKARLELVEAEFRYIKSKAAVAHVYRAYRVAPSWDMLKAVEEQVLAHRTMLEWLQPQGKPREPGGRRLLRSPFSTGHSVNSGPIAMPDAAPYKWDFAKIRESGVLPALPARPRPRPELALKPYAPQLGAAAPQEGGIPQADDAPVVGFNDPTINAPFDQ